MNEEGKEGKRVEINPTYLNIKPGHPLGLRKSVFEKIFFLKISQTALSATQTALSAKVTGIWIRMRAKRDLQNFEFFRKTAN